MKLMIALLLVLVSAASSDVIRAGTLQGRSDGSNVTIQWGTNDESAIKEFAVERRSGTAGEFTVIAVIAKKGNNSFYEYIDKSAFKSSGSCCNTFSIISRRCA